MSKDERRELIATAAAELFAERGYRGASVDEIARRAGVTPPVLYEHFSSKVGLYRHLLERHFADLRRIWGEHFPGEGPLTERLAKAVDGWFAYVEAHPFAGRVLFRDGAGDPEIAPVHEEVAERSRAEVMRLFVAEPGSEKVAGATEGEALEMTWVVLRGVLQGLAVWWADHPSVARERVVATAMNSLWFGLERTQRGEGWPATRA
ncbi:MAG TPA: TetR/AcrR family transcriptional regulator [Solirubrobacterales bacterium]|nr:TetR/AcrR family transcriptional regulator [Solirubrobacterales bacterium]